MLRAKPADFLFLYPSLVTFWGTLVANDATIVHFTFYIYFTGALHLVHCRPRCSWGAMRGTPLDTPLCGVERIRKLNERERGVKKYGGAGAGRSQSGVVGGYRSER